MPCVIWLERSNSLTSCLAVCFNCISVYQWLSVLLVDLCVRYAQASIPSTIIGLHRIIVRAVVSLFISGWTVVYKSHYKRPQFPPKVEFGGPYSTWDGIQRLNMRRDTASHVASLVDWPSRTLLTVRPARQDAVLLRCMTTTALIIVHVMILLYLSTYHRTVYNSYSPILPHIGSYKNICCWYFSKICLYPKMNHSAFDCTTKKPMAHYLLQHFACCTLSKIYILYK